MCAFREDYIGHRLNRQRILKPVAGSFEKIEKKKPKTNEKNPALGDQRHINIWIY